MVLSHTNVEEYIFKNILIKLYYALYLFYVVVLSRAAASNICCSVSIIFRQFDETVFENGERNDLTESTCPL